MRKREAKLLIPVWVCLILPFIFLSGCAAPLGHEHDPKKQSDFVPTGKGTVTFDGMYEFKKPEGWKMFRDLGDGETIFMFFKAEEGEHPAQTSIFLNEKVYGNSRDLNTRAQQFIVYFLAGRGIKMNITKTEDGMVDGRPVLIVHSVGENPYRNEKAKSVAYFYKTGEFIVSLACTQWRAMNADFGEEPFQVFEEFVKSFHYVKKPFYEEIEERIKNLKS